MDDGLHAALRDRLLVLTFDTARSPVNVFTPRTGARLVAELQRGLACGARAIVLRSAKPASFINGVGLLLAASSRSEVALAEAGRIRGFYDALARVPVPTVAAIRGNCFGCGLELALACDVRLVEDVPATRFRMPEVSDYGFMPLFGGTQRLPRAVGAERALDLIAFGAHLHAREALRAGLVDALVPRGDLDRAAALLVRELHQKRPRPPPRPLGAADQARIARKIARLPGESRPLARAALRLVTQADEARGMELELSAFRRTIATRGAGQAMGFFFVRQAAKAHSIGTSGYGAPPGVRAAVRGVPLLSRALAPQPAAGRAISFVARGAGDCVVMRAGAAPRGPVAAYVPLPGAPLPPVELVAFPAANAAKLRDIFLLLEDAGFDPVVTRARGSFIADRMLRARRAKDPVLALALVAAAALAADEARPEQLDLLAHAVGGFPLSRGSLLRHLDAARLPELREALRGRRGFYLP